MAARYKPHKSLKVRLLGVKENLSGWLFVIPVLAGILLFTIIPMLTSLRYAFHDYNPYARDVADQLTNFGLQNFIRIFTPTSKGGDLENFLHSVGITFRYAIVSIPINLVGSYILALFINKKNVQNKAFSIIYYLPCLIPAVAGTLLWKDITKIDSGYINLLLEAFGLEKYTFYEAVETVFPTMLFINLFTLGGNIIMWLSQMRAVPNDLYDAAEIDGATYLRKTFAITIPMTSSMIFYLLVINIISVLQMYSGLLPLQNGVNNSEINFIGVKIYNAAFMEGRMSYACALSWVLFFIIACLTATVFKTSKWVYYGDQE